MTIAELLHSIGMAEHLPAFKTHEITEDLLCELTTDDLREMGISALGHRKRILAAIAERYGCHAAGPGNGPAGRTDEPGVAGIAGSGAATTADEGHAENRQVTVVFCDLVGSTALSHNLPAEDLRSLIRAYQAVVRDSIERYGGYVAQYLGDGVLAYFGFPQCHEDDAERAVRAALDQIVGLADMQTRFGERFGVDVKIRVGIETGYAIVGDMLGEGNRREMTIVGESPNIAARLQELAEPGSVVIGPETRALLPATAQIETLGAHHLKGIADPVPVWRVNGFAFGGGRFESQRRRALSLFVGRDEDLNRLQRALGRVRAGEAVAVHVVGEPGIGKSRLVYEFLRRAPASTRVLKGYCTPHGASVLHPFADLLKRRARLRAEASIEPPEKALFDDIIALNADLAEDAPYLLRLAGLPPVEAGIGAGRSFEDGGADAGNTGEPRGEPSGGVDPDLIGVRTQAALVRLFTAIGQVLPTVLFVNDIHWIDERSEDVLDSLVRTNPLGVLQVFTSRPGYTPPWKGHDTVEEIALGPLDAEAVAKLYRSRTDTEADMSAAEGASKSDADDPSALIEDIVERSGGNPFFVEELATHAGMTALETAAGSEGSRRPEGAPVPSSLSGLLLQRVDRLSEKAKVFLRTGAAIGRRFPADLALPNRLEREQVVKEVTAGGLVIREDGSPEIVRFSHALLQDAIYDSLLKSDRRSLHARIAYRLEDQYAGSETEVAENLARHFEIAGEPRAAARYAVTAGEKALQLFALRDADAWFRKSLAAFPAEPDGEEEHLRALAVSNLIQISCWDARFGDMVRLADRELSRLRAIGEDADVSHALSWLAEAYLHSERFQDASVILHEALNIGERLGDEDCIGHALAELSWLNSIIGLPEDRENTMAELERLKEIAARRDDRLQHTFAHYADWANAIHDGRLADGRRAADLLIAYGDETGYPPSNCWGRCMLAYAEALARNPEEALQYCAEAAQAAECAFDRLVVDLCRAVVLQESGQSEEALEALANAAERDQSVGSFFFGYASLTARGAALAAVGRHEEGRHLLETAAADFKSKGHYRGEAMALVALGSLLCDTAPEAADGVLNSAAEASANTGMQGLRAKAMALRGRIKRERGDRHSADAHFEAARRCVNGLGWLALEQSINAAAAGLDDRMAL